ncbi:MAG: hypothetical protein EP329_20800 [Deltaproteobacteria bacterium]|nr:MAG: hypothetical protein EP329_20800 [Deltaproteobacteria bacterium]
MQARPKPHHLVAAWLLALLVALAAPAAAAPDANPFAQGRSRVGISGGGVGSAGHYDFYIAGSFGYFLVDNLELGGDLALWFGDTPFYAQLGPAVRYIVPLDADVKPYLGAFYRHWFMTGDAADADTVGARLGLLIQSRSFWLTLGAAYEAVVSECSGDCDDFYPEFGLSFVF